MSGIGMSLGTFELICKKCVSLEVLRIGEHGLLPRRSAVLPPSRPPRLVLENPGGSRSRAPSRGLARRFCSRHRKRCLSSGPERVAR